ncbi:uncharacterized protein V1510DRAFT_415241 [Dipodascopsis tothii]|uniref:uncharacterized protein n=1 Tax=Dipodascopsis tothii TaxID=44089 RepID=UPI0034CDD8D7
MKRSLDAVEETSEAGPAPAPDAPEDRSSSRSLSPKSTPRRADDTRPDDAPAKARSNSTSAGSASYYDSIPEFGSTPKMSGSAARQLSLSRRLAQANLPPITPVTTRSKDRQQSEQASTEPNPGVPTVAIDLKTNADYIALSSTLEILKSQQKTATEDVATLQKLKLEALNDPEGFIARLKRDRKVDGAPSMQTIVKAPIVRWNKYGISNPGLEKEVEVGVVERDARFGAVRVFNANEPETN